MVWKQEIQAISGVILCQKILKDNEMELATLNDLGITVGISKIHAVKPEIT